MWIKHLAQGHNTVQQEVLGPKTTKSLSSTLRLDTNYHETNLIKLTKVNMHIGIIDSSNAQAALHDII